MVLAYKGRKEGIFLFNNALNTFYLWLYGLRTYGKEPFRDRERKPAATSTWATFFSLAARVLLYAPSNRQDSTHHDLCYISRGALAGTRNSSP